MSNPFAIFKIKREERGLFIIALLVFAGLNALLIASHWDLYTKSLMHGGSWSVLHNHFEMSGYDCLSWLTIAEGRVDFITIRHPLYASFLYPMYWLNHWLMSWTGIDFAVIMMGIIITFSATYSAVFFFRINREVLALNQADSILLTALLFSFAHVLVPCMTPDHFAITMLLLMMTLYICGKCMLKGRKFKAWQGLVLTFFCGGMASSNVIKMYLAEWFVNGKKFFRPKYLLMAVIMPVVLLLGIQRIQYYQIEVPFAVKNEKVVKANTNAKSLKKSAEHSAYLKANGMKHFSKDSSSLLYLFDFTTPRIRTLLDNYFGEGFQLHDYQALKDIDNGRDEFVSYHFWGNYVVECLVILLFVIGLVFGIRQKYYQLVLTWYSFDFFLNIICGFAINEVYIMTSGWAYIIPIGIGYMIKEQEQSKSLPTVRVAILLLTSFLWIWNLRLIVCHLL